MIAKTLAGLEGVLEKELVDLGAQDVKQQRRAVSFTGDTKILYKVNLWSRTALSILQPLFEFSFETQQEYYDKLREYKWDDIFSVDKTIAINALAFDSVFTNTHFLAQRTKDAIVDFFTDKTGKRPSVDIDEPQIKINVFITKNTCSISLDSSGAPLFKRGYRRKNVTAPLNEVLGAGLVLLTGWDKQQPFYDPMCGSATFSIEAAMIALNMAPSIFRRNFSFFHWQDFDTQLWESLKQEARDGELNNVPEILASDISNLAMDAARQNLMEAGLLGRVKLEKRDFFQSKPTHENGTVIINPPYGRRLQSENINEYYQNMGTALKHNYAGFKAYIISPDKILTHKIGLRHSSQKMVFNGQIECRFLGYELYKGTKKIHKTDLPPKPQRKRIDPDKKQG
jgi:putative N6-adenine-specific DNA methylase